MATDESQQRLDGAPLARAFAQVQSKDQESGSEEEESIEPIENAQSEAASQPPSSRPSSPLSLTGSRRSEEAEPVEYEMDEDDD